MSDYMDLVKEEATAFFKESRTAFLDDAGEHGGKSERPNYLRWIDERGELAGRIETVTASWGLKECQWVQSNTRSKPPPGGDRKSIAFGSFLQDVRHAIKKLAKK